MRTKIIPDLPSTTLFDMDEVAEMQEAAKRYLDIAGARMAGYGCAERQGDK